MGTQLPLLDHWIVQENKWRATRYGLEADIIIDENGTQISLKSAIIETIETIMPVAFELGCQETLKGILNQLEDEVPPYRKQLDLYNQNNDFKEVLSDFVQTFKDSVLD
tara:strand:- start:221 stop:547 length:327 start_codon:yes stop_codon:yes gene_type:complete